MTPVRILLQIGTRYWATGEDDVSFAGETWAGAGPLQRLDLPDHAFDPGERSAAVALQVTDTTLRDYVVGNPGPEDVDVRIVYSLDGGATWTAGPYRFRGQLGRSTFQDGVWNAEITRKRRNARVFDAEWTHEDQQAAYPGDRGLERMAAIAEGERIRWPP